MDKYLAVLKFFVILHPDFNDKAIGNGGNVQQI